ncbi:MAG: hypothetical protein ACRD9S_24865, partial [Pyrinomonadaceae bacterium]
AAVIVGSGVILFDPIFQGLAISLMAGEVASLLLSRMTVPVLFYMSERKKYERPSVELLIPPPESLDDSEARAVEAPTSSVEGVPEVEAVEDCEPARGNEQPIEAEHRPTPDMPDVADGVNEGQSPGTEKTDLQ